MKTFTFILFLCLLSSSLIKFTLEGVNNDVIYSLGLSILVYLYILDDKIDELKK